MSQRAARGERNAPNCIKNTTANKKSTAIFEIDTQVEVVKPNRQT